MNDFLYRGIIKKLNVRFTYASTTKLINQAILKHNCDPVSGHILGRCLTSGVLVSPLLNEKERFTLKWDYPEGLIRKITVDVGANADVRGFSNKKSVVEKADDLMALYGNKGILSVVKSDSKKILQSSSCEAYLHNPINDLSLYYSVSEQTETEIQAVIGFNNDPKNPVRISQGFLIQALPDCDLDVMVKLREKMNSSDFKELLKNEPAHNNYFEKLVNILIEDYDDVNYSLNGCPTPQFKCYCSFKKIIQATSVLPKENLLEHLHKKKPLVVSCNFCSAKYQIPDNVITQLLKEKQE